MNSEKFIAQAGTKRVLVLSGSGLSTECGNPRLSLAEEELWDKININDVSNIARLSSKYHLIHSFYNTLRTLLPDKEPNEAHYYLAHLQSTFGDRFLHMTACTDDLCERSGSNPIHLLGYLPEVIECYSMAHDAFKVKNIGYEAYIPDPEVYAKPNIVMTGENERYVDGERLPLYEERDAVLNSLTDLDTVIIIGSSNTVLRWSDMVGLDSPAFTVNVNTKKNENDWVYDKKIYKPAHKATSEIADIIRERTK